MTEHPTSSWGPRRPGSPFPFQIPEPCSQRPALFSHENSENQPTPSRVFQTNPLEVHLGGTPQTTCIGASRLKGTPGFPRHQFLGEGERHLGTAWN